MHKGKPWLFLFPKVTPCACRCKHCDFVVDGPFPHVPFDRVREYLQPFIDMRDAGEAIGNIALVFSDAPLNYPGLAAGNRFLKAHDIEGWQSIPANGFRIRRASDWPAHLAAVRDAGTQYFEFTLYGEAPMHDEFAARSGDFAAIEQVAGLWHTAGGQTMWSITLTKNNVSETETIRAHVQDKYGVDCSVSLWTYLGSGSEIEDLRPESADRDCLTPDFQERLSNLKPEREWVANLRDSDASPYVENPPVLRVVIDRGGNAVIPYTPAPEGHNGLPVGRFPVDSAADFIEQWYTHYQSWRTRYPTVGELAMRHGDETSERLHDYRSVTYKWCHAHDGQSG